jgi:hypothetical protein
MVRDAIRRSAHLIITSVLMQSGSTATLPRPAILGVAPGSSRSAGPGQYEPLSIPLDTIEDHPDPFLGREISVDGEVEQILGPGAFIIDEPGWVDFDNEVLVIVPSKHLAVVREGDRITVIGTLLSAAEAAFDPESAQIERDRRGELADRSVIIAGRIDVSERQTGGRHLDR